MLSRGGSHRVQAFVAEMRVPCGCRHIRMAQQFFHIVKRHAFIHESRGERVPQIVNADIGQARACACAVPCKEDIDKGLARARVRENPIALIPTIAHRPEASALELFQHIDGGVTRGCSGACRISTRGSSTSFCQNRYRSTARRALRAFLRRSEAGKR